MRAQYIRATLGVARQVFGLLQNNIRNAGLDAGRRFSAIGGAQRFVLTAGLLFAVSASAATSAISIANGSAAVVNGANTTINFRLSRSGDTSAQAVVAYSTHDGSAIAGTDYVGTQANATFVAGATTATISIPVTGHSGIQANKSFTVQLSSATGLGKLPSFNINQQFNAGQRSGSVAVADINADGKPDLMIANSDDNTVSVFINNTSPGSSTSTFAAEQVFVCPAVPVSITAADVNGDGIPDMVVASSTAGVLAVRINTTSRGSATATFAPQQTYPVGKWVVSAAAADINGDGRPDLVSVGESQISVLINETAPGATASSFAAADAFALQGTGPQDLKIADVNGDGKPDILVARVLGDNGVELFLNQTSAGASSASFAASQLIPSAFNAYSIAVADLNEDGKPDLVALTTGSSPVVQVLFNTTAPGDSAASFVANPSFNLNLIAIFRLAIADINGDGKPDIMVGATNDESVGVLVNDTPPGSVSGKFVSDLGFRVTGAVEALAAADLNGDGLPDVIAIGQTTSGMTDQGHATILINTTNVGTNAVGYTSKPTLATDNGPYSIAAGDLNGDGKLDLVTANQGAGSASVLINNSGPGPASPAFSVQQSISTGGSVFAAALQDINDDSKPDLLVADGANAIWVRLNTTAAGSSTASFADPQSFGAGSTPESVVAMDVNGDGLPDLIVANTATNKVSVLINSTTAGATTPSFAGAQPFDAGNSPTAVAAADINGDGKPDLLVANSGDNKVGVLINATAPGSSTASFAAQQTFDTGSNPSAVTVADINGDGLPDLIVANDASSGTLSVLFNTTTPGSSTASFAVQQTVAVGSYPQSVVATDINNDGRPDILVANYNAGGSGSVSLLINKTLMGDSLASFAQPATLATGLGPSAALAVDINNDGYKDIVAANNANNAGNSVSVLLNTQQQMSVSATAANATISYQSSVANPFSFTAITNATPNSTQTSNTITVSGTNIPSAISISGGTYSVNGGTYTSAKGTVNPGDSVKVQMVASSSYSTSTAATLNIGGTTGAFTVTTAPDVTPDPFSFTAKTNVDPGIPVTSYAIQVTGIDVAVPISIKGGQYAITHGGVTGAFTSSPGTISPNDHVKIQLTSSAKFSTQTEATLNVGGVTGSFDVTTRAADTKPDPFGFLAVTGADPGVNVVSATIAITGIEVAVPISITGGQYSITHNGFKRAFTSAAGSFNPGDLVTVELTSSTKFSTQTHATLTVGGVNGEFDVLTRDAHTLPNPFTFNAVTGADTGVNVVSNTVTITGIEVAVPISIVGGKYSITHNGFVRAYTSDAGTINPGDLVTVELTSSSSFSTKTSTTLNINGVTGTFNVTTKAKS